MSEEADQHLFQVNLRGIIDILANHLYSSPNVFVRELLQNSCDAIAMRRLSDPDFRGQISLEVVPPAEADPAKARPTLVCSDDGVGLTKEEVHRFLATVGQSSKRDDLFQASGDFIGQFGIGLLSCFTVSEEITLITKSAREPDAPACKWVAHVEGTYELTELTEDVAPGTTVYLRARPGFDKLFTREELQFLATNWGQLLPFDIQLSGGTIEGKDAPSTRITKPSHPLTNSQREFDRLAALRFGADLFPEEPEFFDALPLQSDIGDVCGVAYILGRPSPQARSQKHRVYLKGMLLAEENESLLPDWAFFARCAVNAQTLRPTASREDFYEDAALEATRDRLGEALRNYLLDLSRTDPDRLSRLISLHWFSFKALAVEDDDFFRTIIDWLPFETTMGRLTIPEMSDGEVVRIARTDDEFRQITGVAGAQGVCIVNATYTYDRDLLERAMLLTGHSLEFLDPRDVTSSFDDLSEEEQEQVFNLVRVADLVLQPYKCTAEVRNFAPEEVPVFFVSNEAAGFLKSIEQSREGKGDPTLGSVLDTLSEDALQEAYCSICFNYRHPQIRRLAELRDRSVLSSAIRMLYLQALFLGQQPLTKREFAILTKGIGQFIDWGIAYSEQNHGS